jgi:hypothetical protein
MRHRHNPNAPGPCPPCGGWLKVDGLCLTNVPITKLLKWGARKHEHVDHLPPTRRHAANYRATGALVDHLPPPPPRCLVVVRFIVAEIAAPPATVGSSAGAR